MKYELGPWDCRPKQEFEEFADTHQGPAHIHSEGLNVFEGVVVC